MEQTAGPSSEHEVIQAPNHAHTRTKSTDSVHPPSTMYGKRDGSSSSTSSVTEETRYAASPPVSTIAEEKGQAHAYSETWADPEAQHAEADSFSQKRFRFIRYTALNVYRRLFSLAFVGNGIAFIILMAKGATPLDLVNASAVNLSVCGLCRQPLVINMLYLIFGSMPRSAPMRLRRLACKIFHFGGVHSGTGVAACIWYIGFAGLYTHSFKPSPTSIAVLALIWLVLALLLAIILVAHPTFRAKRHDYFELTHRFSNWLVLALFWTLLFLLASQEQEKSPSTSIGTFLIHLPTFWLLLLLTLATVHPWLLLRRVPVVAEPLSPHAIRLHFSHTTVKFAQGISVARHPLADWHAFAGFTDQFDSPATTKFSCLVSRAGDWTRDTITTLPTHLWTRGVPTYGFGYVCRMFERIIVVTTGSGIGPCLSFMWDKNRPAIRVVWQTKSPLKTYGQRTLDLVKRMDERAVVIDSSVSGRVDMLPIVLRLYKELGAEAVCVISNPAVTKGLVYALERRGIAAYGPIFDS
ncbi:hypothetical protein C8A03DRAFT_18508 [Achaetomium macrosporum]|uniref:Integral membrane protein TmpA n=1 Tax=Achaetomium macrosporum TaxID=79813 RepID=A0AAN7H8Q4_9PEZI|nr:hypothetical protein C8A03DRAFT_18508 [Achaetomium macrosporum]